jgi:hypothetical protein
MPNLIPAVVFLCPLGTAPAACGMSTATQVHIVKVSPGSCERDAQAMAAKLWFVDGKEFTMKVVCDPAEAVR